jgi:type II secretory pathway component PulM
VNVFAAIARFWNACSPRERVAVASGIILVAGTALYLLLWGPGMAARKSLSDVLPRLRAQLEDMRWQREEVAALRKKVGASTPAGDLAVVLRASAAQAPFALAVERIDGLPGDKARMQAGPLPFDAWLAWIRTLQRELGIRVEACRVAALDEPGMVRVEASFTGGGAQ